MSHVHAIYENGVFRPVGHIEVPDLCEVEFDLLMAPPAAATTKWMTFTPYWGDAIIPATRIPERSDDDGTTKSAVEYPPGKETSLGKRRAQGRSRNEGQRFD